MLQNAEGVLISRTESVCPVCLKRISANRMKYGEDVYLEKTCEEHGPFRAVIWRGNDPAYADWGGAPLSTFQTPVCGKTVELGCPFDCGLCTAHRQQTCCVLLEVTGRCNLQCPVCFAQAGVSSQTDEPSLPEIESWYKKLMSSGGPFNIQLSGGEPTMRDDLPEIIAMGSSMGFPFIQVNTNGLRLASDVEYARQLKSAGLSCVFLQFDGTSDEIYTTIRGRALFRIKNQAIERCAELGLGVVLAVTVIPGVNDGAVGEIIQFAVERMPTVRGVHFQPISYFGRYPKIPANEDRITIPELIRAIGRQTGGRIPSSSLHPPRAENAYCSFQGNYVLMPDGELKSWRQREPQGCCRQEPAAGAKKAREFVAQKWRMPAGTKTLESTTEGALSGAYDCCGVNTDSLDAFLDRVERYSFCISGMAFQDAWTLDLERLRECFIHVVAEDARIIPFCAYNLTDCDGHSLYRPLTAVGRK
jgi:7,8-dihydro-6-hydroxymethylpterin dimethyltransferase